MVLLASNMATQEGWLIFILLVGCNLCATVGGLVICLRRDLGLPYYLGFVIVASGAAIKFFGFVGFLLAPGIAAVATVVILWLLRQYGMI